MRPLILLALSLLCCSAMLAAGAAGPELGPERPLKSSAIAPARDVGYGLVASDGSDYLVVWSALSLRAARVSRSGQLLDPLGFSVIPAQCSGGSLRGVTGGTRSYLVSYSCGRGGGTDAALVGPNGIERTVHLSGGTINWIVWTGALYLLVSEDGRMASYLDESGDRVGLPFEVAPAGFYVTYVVAEAGHVVALLGNTPADTYDPTAALWMTTIVDGRVSEAIPLEGWNVGGSGQPSFDGERLLVRYMVGGVFDRARIYALDGRIIRPDFELPLSAERNIADITWQGEFYIARYTTNTSLDQSVILRLDRDGNPLDQSPTPTAGGVWGRSRGGFFAVLSTGDTLSAEGRRLYGTLLDLRGSPVQNLSAQGSPLAFCRLRQDNAAQAWDGRELITAWREQAESPTGYVLRIAGTFRGAADVSIPLRESTNSGIPSIASIAGMAMVVWLDAARSVDPQRVLAARFSPREGLLDPEPLVLSTRAWFAERPQVVWDGAQFVVVWGEGDLYGGEQVRMVASRVTAEGVVLDPEPVQLGDGRRSQIRPAIARSGEFVTIAWEEADALIVRAQVNFLHRDVKVRRLDTGLGMVAYPSVNVASAMPDGNSDPSAGSVACAERGCLVLYLEGGIPIANVRAAFIDVTLLTTGGSVETTTDLGGNSQSPVVIWNGREFAGSWSRRNGDDYDVIMHRFEPDGRPAETGEVPVAHSPEAETNPSLSTRGDGSVTVVYERTAVEPEFGGAVQIFLRQEFQRLRPSRR
ncbi:MAG: hypothetical protein WC538_19725 [Thermoanaerobaculia bacterium]|jgi:hypothetical protein